MKKLNVFLTVHHELTIYSKTCLKRNAIVPVFFFRFTGFRFTKGCVLIKQSTKNMIA